jgi:succinoglycan biosynthesis protein ExoM
MTKVVVAIPTFRRPKSLAHLLDALGLLATAHDVLVLVADNDGERHEGFDLCQRLKPYYRWPLESIVVAERGIAQVRNALVAGALAQENADFIAMIDDDEWPSPDWLDELLKVQCETQADVVQGSILFWREASAGAWSENFDGIASIRRPTGRVTMVEGAGNLLLNRHCFDGLAKPWFDPAFGLSGGEDREFFVRLAHAGASFAWADEATAYGDVAQERLNWRWALARSYSIGNADMRVVLKHWPGAVAIGVEALKIAGAFALAPVLTLFNAPNPNRRLEGLRILFRAAGKAAALMGARSERYGISHGE